MGQDHTYTYVKLSFQSCLSVLTDIPPIFYMGLLLLLSCLQAMVQNYLFFIAIEALRFSASKMPICLIEVSGLFTSIISP